ncbi:MAG: hypothetical protein KME49_22680 [Brasilonema octagenarum HA4186-MV1]|nr:hypothetical protein [Brasilonema octagenarum HA4186-MV1]
MTFDALEQIGYRLGIGGHVGRQETAFKYVIENADKSPEELVSIILKEKGREFPDMIVLAANRVVSNVLSLHKTLEEEDLSQKWWNRFSEDEQSSLIPIPEEFTSKNKMIRIYNPNFEKSKEYEFATKVIRVAVQHYLEDIKGGDNFDKLNNDELQLLKKIKETPEIKISEQKVTTSEVDKLTEQYWQSVFYQIDCER